MVSREWFMECVSQLLLDLSEKIGDPDEWDTWNQKALEWAHRSCWAGFENCLKEKIEEEKDRPKPKHEKEDK